MAAIDNPVKLAGPLVAAAPPAFEVDPSEDARILGRLVELSAHARGAEELLTRLARSGRIRPILPCGRTRTALVGAGHALEPGDALFGTARDWPAAMARGLSADALIAQAFGRRPERTMPGAIFDKDLGVWLSEATHAGHMAEAVGFGIAQTMKGSQAIALCCLGSATLMLPEATAALIHAVERRARVVFLLRGPKGPIDRLVVVHRIVVPPDSAHRVYWAIAEGRTARPGLPFLIDARWERRGPGWDDAPPPPADDAIEAQARGILSPEMERALAAEVRDALDKARAAAERDFALGEGP